MGVSALGEEDGGFREGFVEDDDGVGVQKRGHEAGTGVGRVVG